MLRLYAIPFLSLVAFSVEAADHTQLNPSKDAPESVIQMKPFIGDWQCSREVRQKDGSWQKPEQVSRWEWRYILNGHAIQDYWYPNKDNLSGVGAGTNVRVFNSSKQQWNMSWTFDSLGSFQTFDANFDGETMVMNGVYPAVKNTPAYHAKITFFNIYPCCVEDQVFYTLCFLFFIHSKNYDVVLSVDSAVHILIHPLDYVCG